MTVKGSGELEEIPEAPDRQCRLPTTEKLLTIEPTRNPTVTRAVGRPSAA